ncbi:hypothetical protein M2390_003146 [Mycetocola sp. BIGb0189]|uniref:DUF7448 domain-containing protein n=1 Tax=Mycetocola sp. BIGb0189 TaxID=2940604 RepID=UPI00216889FA|nr:hypothetical protein [Mycetocola sp. BIGb0189]MCS4277378.1 hypothetical protein [Mycetocola sp. BIGb0189]MCS4277930.1 hypothetical protein [Mycetocola sp. BIGb0189]
MSKTIYDMTESDLSGQLIGKSITAIAGKTMTLNDGTVLEFENAADCCAWFDATLESIDLNDNAITAVTRVGAKAAEDYDEAWSLHILSAHKLIAKVNIEGNASSGYYCHSILLNVKPAVA